MKTLNLKYFGVTILIFRGHVTSSVTWSFDSAYVVFYWWSIVTMHLSCTVTEIWRPKDIGVTTLTLWGHVTSSITWPSDSAWALSYWWSMMTMCLFCTGTEIQGFEDFGRPLEPCVYLAPLRRYKASKLHLPMLKAKSSVRMRRVTWPVGRGSKITTYWNYRGHIAYSLYNFYVPTMTIRGRL